MENEFEQKNGVENQGWLEKFSFQVYMRKYYSNILRRKRYK